jgi:hypothetical protein
MTDGVSKFKSALLRIKTHANDDHDGDVKENILPIFESLSKQEKIAILEDMVDTHFAEIEEIEDHRDDTVRAELELLKAKDDLKRSTVIRWLLISATIMTVLVFTVSAVKAVLELKDGDDITAFFKAAAELMAIVLGFS